MNFIKTLILCHITTKSTGHTTP